MPDLKILKRFKISDSFFGRYERLIKDEVIPYQEKALKDEIEGAEKSHCIENFRMAAEKNSYRQMQRRILRNGFSGQRCCQMA